MLNKPQQQDILEHSAGHIRVLGGPGSGKSSLVVAKFRQLQSVGRKPAIVAYTQAHQARLTEKLIGRETGHFGRVPVITFSQLSSRILELADRGRRSPLRDTDELVVLSHAMETIGGGLRSDYKEIAHSDAFQRTVLGVMHVLLQNNVGSEAASDAAGRAQTGRCADLLRIYSAFRIALDAHRLVTFYDIAWRAAESLSVETNPLWTNDALLVDDAQDIDPGQVRLLEAMAPPDGNTDVLLFGDPTGPRFAFRGTSSGFLLRRFPERYRPTDFQLNPYAAQHHDLDRTLDRLIADVQHATAGRPTPAIAGDLTALPLFSATSGDTPSHATVVKRPPGDPVAVESYCAEDPVAEAQTTAREVRRLLDEGARPGDIALVARDRHHYEHILSLAFADEGIAIESGRAGTFTPETFVRALLGALVATPDERTVETIVSSPLFGPLRDALATELQLGDGSQVRAVADLHRIIDHFGRKLGGRRRDHNIVPRVIEEVLRPLLENNDATAGGEALASITALSNEWSRYRETVAVLGTRTSIAEFLRFYRPGEEVGRRDPDRVGFYTAREMVGASFSFVFLLGCADGMFPRVERSETYIPYREIESLFDGIVFHESRARGEQMCDEQRLAITALTRARRRLVMSFPARVARETNAAPASVFAGLFGDGAEVVLRRPGMHLRAAHRVAGGPIIETAIAEASPIETLWLTRRPQAASFSAGRFPMSPSRLETFSGCERKLFYTRIMGIDEEKTIPLTIGSLFHNLMEAIARECPSRDELLALTDDRIDALVDDAVRASRDLGPADSLIETITRDNVAAMVRSARRLEKDRKPGYRIADVERSEPFDYEGQQFIGKIDRIDEMDGQYTVIDYKTGEIKKRGATIMKYARGESGKGPRHWQLPFYAQSIKAQEGALPELFCYYVIRPGMDPYAVGLFISDDPDRRAHVERFHASHQKNFCSVSPDELDSLMNEAGRITERVFAERTEFPRTDDLENCRNCSFNRVCERRTHEPQF